MFVEFMNLWFEKGIPLFSLELEFFILMLTSTDLHSEQSLSKRFILGDQWDNYFKLISVMKNDSPVNLWMFLNLKATEMHFHSNAKCKGKCLQSCHLGNLQPKGLYSTPAMLVFSHQRRNRNLRLRLFDGLLLLLLLLCEDEHIWWLIGSPLE